MIQKMKGGDADISVHFPSKLGYQTILCTQVVFCFGPTTSLVTEYKLISISEWNIAVVPFLTSTDVPLLLFIVIILIHLELL
jgi:hypothetical protein